MNNRLPKPVPMGSKRTAPLVPDSPTVVVLRPGDTLITDGSETIDTLILYDPKPPVPISFEEMP